MRAWETATETDATRSAEGSEPEAADADAPSNPLLRTMEISDDGLAATVRVWQAYHIGDETPVTHLVELRCIAGRWYPRDVDGRVSRW